jgi:hypothetical protein
MEAARWWILENKLDHFEKVVKIKNLASTEQTLKTQNRTV